MSYIQCVCVFFLSCNADGSALLRCREMCMFCTFLTLVYWVELNIKGVSNERNGQSTKCSFQFKKLLFSSLLLNSEWRKSPFRSVEAAFTLSHYTKAIDSMMHGYDASFLKNIGYAFWFPCLVIILFFFC